LGQAGGGSKDSKKRARNKVSTDKKRASLKIKPACPSTLLGVGLSVVIICLNSRYRFLLKTFLAIFTLL
jgi:hypothetical protein